MCDSYTVPEVDKKRNLESAEANSACFLQRRSLRILFFWRMRSGGGDQFFSNFLCKIQTHWEVLWNYFKYALCWHSIFELFYVQKSVFASRTCYSVCKLQNYLYCCNLSGGVALIVWFTTNGLCVKNNTIHICGANKQYKSDRGVEALLILTCEPLNVTTSVRGEWSWHVNSIVACCHSAKLHSHAAQDFRSQHAGIVWDVFYD